MIILEVIGFVAMVQGFGSAIFTQVFNGNWALMKWALEYQPWAGIGIGLIGLVLVIATEVARKKRRA